MGGEGVPLSLSNFFDSDNITLKQPLSLSKKFDSVNGSISHCRTFPTDFIGWTNVEFSVVDEREGGGGRASLSGELFRQ
jgi:hypothetical protein